MVRKIELSKERMDRVKNEEIERRMELIGTDTLYHYTSIDSLYHIIKNKEIWFTNTSVMNDKSESINFVSLLEKELLNACSKKADDIASFFNSIEQRISTEAAYAFCLSCLKDDASQWERYADYGKGACICIDVKKLLSVFYRYDVICNKVFYDSDIKDNMLYFSLLSYFEGTGTYPYPDISVLSNFIVFASFVNKHNSFKTESEFRVGTTISDIEKIKGMTRDFVLSKGEIKNILRLNLKKIFDNDINQIDLLFSGVIIGPKSNQSKRILSEYFSENGFINLSKAITISDCPLR